MNITQVNVIFVYNAYQKIGQKMNKTIFKNETIYFFSVDHDSIEKEDIPNIQQ